MSAASRNHSKVSPAPLAVRSIILKALALFILINLVFAAVYPLDALGRISAYNRVFPGRVRLPYGDIPERANNLSLYNLEAMFASHEISAPKAADEFRVVVIGDSATWGFLLPPEETLSSHLNTADLKAPDGRRLRFYNLGYPVMSVTKDLLILTYALRYQPDLIIWPITLESLPFDKQLFPPLLQNNPGPVSALIESNNLQLDSKDLALQTPGIWQRTLVGARRHLADLIRLQLFGVAWAATGIDQDLPAKFTPWQANLQADESFHNLHPPHLSGDDLALDTLQAGIRLAGSIPVLLINEPMAISSGENAHLRYNFFYPRWAYDDYRQIIRTAAEDHGWTYLDAWDVISSGEFTNSAVHLTPLGSREFSIVVADAVRSLLINQYTIEEN